MGILPPNSPAKTPRHPISTSVVFGKEHTALDRMTVGRFSLIARQPVRLLRLYDQKGILVDLRLPIR